MLQLQLGILNSPSIFKYCATNLENNRIDGVLNYVAIIENDYPVYITYNIFIIYRKFPSILFWNVISNITFVMANSYQEFPYR